MPKKILRTSRKKTTLPEQKEAVIQALSELRDSTGWKLILRALDENIADAEKQIADPEIRKLPPDQFMARMTELLNKKDDRIAMKDLPESIAYEVTNADSVLPQFDPYDL